MPQVDNPTKVRENRLRAAAERQGLFISKSRRRDPRALDFNTWAIVDVETNTLVEDQLTLEDVEAYLSEEA